MSTAPPSTGRIRTTLIGTVGLLILAAIYAPGFADFGILDDKALLDRHAQVQQAALSEILINSRSGPTGRPVAEITYWLQTKFFGFDLSAAKAGNLLFHCLAILLAGALSLKLGRQAGSQRWYPLLPVALWALAPLHVSTILYASQRMTILAAIFVLAALLVFALWRSRPSPGRNCTLVSWVSIACLGGLAVMAKETGALLPLYLLVVDWMISRTQQRQRIHRTFLQLFVAVPLISALIIFVVAGDRWMAAYVIRDFDPLQRLLSESRAIWHHVGAVLTPSPKTLGVYHDDFVVSRSWLEPPSTLLSFTGLLVLIGGAVAVRRRAPLVTAGVAFFLVGHVLEGGILPLELYFEHRNYLPSLGLFAALTAGSWAVAGKIRSTTLLPAIAFGFMALSAALTLQRTVLWSDPLRLNQRALQVAPESFRAHTALATQYLQACSADPFDALLEDAERINPGKAAGLAVHSTLFGCVCDGGSTGSRLRELSATVPEMWYDPYLVTAINQWTELYARTGCPHLDPDAVARALEPWLNAGLTSRDRGSVPILQRLGVILALTGRMDSAERLQALLWAKHHDIDAGLELAALKLAAGDTQAAEDLLDTLRERAGESRSTKLAELERRLNQLHNRPPM